MLTVTVTFGQAKIVSVTFVHIKDMSADLPIYAKIGNVSKDFSRLTFYHHICIDHFIGEGQIYFRLF